MRMTLTAPAALEATDTDARTLRGIAVPYGTEGFTSAGPVTIDAGAIRVPENLRAVKLFREHGRQTPIGYALDASDTADALHMGFQLARTPDGDLALLEAAEGLRDALSVELNNVTVTAGHVTGADLVAVAQVAVPAFSGAQLVATLTDDEQADVLELANQIAAIAAPTDPDAAAPDAAAAATTNGETPVTTTASLPAATMTPARTTPRPTPATDRTLFAAAAAAAFRGASDASQVNGALTAALTDIVPTEADPGNAFMRPQWLGELWTPRAVNRPFITAIGSQPLTSMTWDGWKWDVYPTVGDYAGEKAEIPTSPGSISPETGTAYRIAGGWDFDRIYEDFNTGFINAFLDAAAVDYALKSEAKVAAFLAANATALAGTATVTEGLNAIAAALTAQGAALSFVGMAPDLFAQFLGVPANLVPWWLQQQGSVSLSAQSTDIAGINVFVAPSLAAKTMLGGDANAVDFRETGPIRVQAVNIPNGGIDAALFGYQGQILNDPRGLAKTVVTIVPPAVVEAEGTTAKKATK